jgi:hypothetical protein
MTDDKKKIQTLRVAIREIERELCNPPLNPASVSYMIALCRNALEITDPDREGST